MATSRFGALCEVSLTLVDPDVYDSANSQDNEADPIVAPRGIDLAGDWDEGAARAQAAQETEDATAEAQPGVALEGEAGELPAEATADDLGHFYRIPRTRIDVVPHGVDEHFFALATDSKPMILCVSTLHPHKNIDNLLRAFSLFRDSRTASQRRGSNLVVLAVRADRDLINFPRSLW